LALRRWAVAVDGYFPERGFITNMRYAQVRDRVIEARAYGLEKQVGSGMWMKFWDFEDGQRLGIFISNETLVYFRGSVYDLIKARQQYALDKYAKYKF
jgi:hypothetical protein